ncbi:hypothetical protein U0070_020319, partial [Myodes glareolus]
STQIAAHSRTGVSRGSPRYLHDPVPPPRELALGLPQPLARSHGPFLTVQAAARAPATMLFYSFSNPSWARMWSWNPALRGPVSHIKLTDHQGSVVCYVHLPADEVDTQLLQDAARKEALQQKTTNLLQRKMGMKRLLMEFDRHLGKKLLCLDCGIDWTQKPTERGMLNLPKAGLQQAKTAGMESSDERGALILWRAMDTNTVEEDPAEERAIGEHLKEEMGRRQGKNSSNNLKNNMKTPDPSDLTTEGLERPIPEEVENSVIMKAIESLKQGMNNSLKEIEDKYNKKLEEMSKEMEDKYNKKVEEMSKFVNDTLGNQEKAIKQILRLTMDGDADGDPHWSTGLSPPWSK